MMHSLVDIDLFNIEDVRAQVRWLEDMYAFNIMNYMERTKCTREKAEAHTMRILMAWRELEAELEMMACPR